MGILCGKRVGWGMSFLCFYQGNKSRGIQTFAFNVLLTLTLHFIKSSSVFTRVRGSLFCLCNINFTTPQVVVSAVKSTTLTVQYGKA